LAFHQEEQTAGGVAADSGDQEALGAVLLEIDLVQGIPFFHAGVELLRSKSLDGNSYNSGDWFNKLDFTYQSNKLGRRPAAGARQPVEVAHPAPAPDQSGLEADRGGRPGGVGPLPRGARHPPELQALPDADRGGRPGAPALPQHRAEPDPGPDRDDALRSA